MFLEIQIKFSDEYVLDFFLELLVRKLIYFIELHHSTESYEYFLICSRVERLNNGKYGVCDHRNKHKQQDSDDDVKQSESLGLWT
jgi:hypothetical protein